MTIMTIDFYMVVKESPARIVKVKPRIFWRQLGSVDPSSDEDSCKANFDKSQFWDTYVVNIDKMSLQHEFKGTCEILAIDSQLVEWFSKFLKKRGMDIVYWTITMKH